MSNEKIKVKVSLPEEAYTLIRAAACIYGLSPKAYLKMVATQCALEDLERLGHVIDAIGDEDAVEEDDEDEARDFEGCKCVCEEDEGKTYCAEAAEEKVAEEKPAEACQCEKKAAKSKKAKKA